jgi:superfamily II DNA or RNA helicase
MVLRPHQQECINKITEHFINNDIGLIKMFCGAGKSFIIYHCLLEYTNSLSIVVVPSINLITQFNKDYLLNDDKKEYNNKYFDKEFELLTICSKNEINKNLNFTTDDDKILQFIELDCQKIILITYQSLETLINIMKENEIEDMIDLICFDEAHHILGNNMKELLFGINTDDDYIESFIDIYCNKTLFFTATPKNSNGIMMYESITCFDNYELLDDESYIADEPDCGKMIYEYMHYNGVNDNILNDFNIMIDLYTENTDTTVYETICRAILETGNNRVLTFHSRSETKSESGSNVIDFVDENQFIKTFKKIRKIEFPQLKNKYKHIVFKGITASSKNKLNILEDFDNTKDDEIYILASCKTIGEGVDTKNANMVVFVDPKQSYIEIIQNIGRVCRKNSKTKRLATILLPTYVDTNKYKDCSTVEEQDEVIRNEMSNTGDFSNILNTLTALRQEDPYMFELCLNHPTVFTNKEFKESVKKQKGKIDKEYEIKDIFKEHKLKYIDQLDEIENLKILSDKIEKNINIVNKKIDENDITLGNYDETLNYIKSEDNKFIKIKCDKKIVRPNRNIKPKYHINNEIKMLWHIDSEIDINKKVFGGYIKCSITMSSDEQWLEILENVKKYIDENDKRPGISDKNKKIKQLALWLSSQLNYYKKNVGKFKNQKIRKIFEKFLNDYSKYFLDNETQWNNTLDKVKRYIDENKKRPSQVDKNKEIKILGRWLSYQKNNYKNRKEIMKNEEIYNRWTTFISEYQEYFLDNETQWNNTLDKIKKYIDENNKRPSNSDINEDIKILGNWISAQKQNYKKKEQIMKNEEIYNKWTTFISEYQEYFLDNETQWNNTLDKIKKYIDENNKRPSSEDINKDIKQLGNWLSTQQQNYKNRKEIMKNEEIYNRWTIFISEYQEYFIDNETQWNNILDKVSKYIDENNKRPSNSDINKEIKILGNWIRSQQQNYKKKEQIMKNEEIYNSWTTFISEYQEYFLDNETQWNNILDKIKKYIDENNKRPSHSDKNKEIKILGNWISAQQQNYKKKEHIMKNEEIYNEFTNFITKYKQYFPNIDPHLDPLSDHQSVEQSEQKIAHKSTKIKPKSDTTEKTNRQLHKSEYQQLSQKMTIQKSSTTEEMFNDNPTLWYQYHEYRDISFQGYDNQDAIPINKIIKYLETKMKYKLKILDLGCGRNLIKQHFRENSKFSIIGYDFVSYNGSIQCDISNLPDEDETVKICIFSQSLMGNNWKDYLDQGYRVLEYNGEMIVAESTERYESIKNFITEINMKIIDDDYDVTNRWFIIHAIKQ